MANDLTVIPPGYLANASYYGLTKEAGAAIAPLTTLARASEVEAMTEALKIRGVEEALASFTAEFACALLMMADAHECPLEPRERGSFENTFDRMFVSKAPLAERMPDYVRRAAVDCMLSAGWACIATLASVDPVRWRTVCLVLVDAFGLKLSVLEKTTLQSLRRARGSVGA
jgi:hypothetical protein